MSTQVEHLLDDLRQQTAAFEFEADQRQAEGQPRGYPTVSTYLLISVLEAVQADMRDLTQPHNDLDSGTSREDA